MTGRFLSARFHTPPDQQAMITSRLGSLTERSEPVLDDLDGGSLPDFSPLLAEICAPDRRR